MSFSSIEEIIRFAAEKEVEAAEFYEDASQQAAFSGAKQVLEDLAGQEKKHYTMLMTFSENKKMLVNYKFKWVSDLKRSDYLVDMVYERSMAYPDLLRLAMKREEKALRLYNTLQQQTDNNDYFNLFKILAQEEAKHKNVMETLYDDYMAEIGD